jgi:hypothetical protein
LPFSQSYQQQCYYNQSNQTNLFKKMYNSHLFDDFLTLIFQLLGIQIRSNKYRHQIDVKYTST